MCASPHATDVVPGDAEGPGISDLSTRGTTPGTTRRLLAVDGAEPNASVAAGQMSPDGRYISFWAAATNWIAGDNNGHSDICIYDKATSTAEAVSVGSAGALSDGYSLQHGMSDSGRWVALSSYATNLAPKDSNSAVDVFLRIAGRAKPP